MKPGKACHHKFVFLRQIEEREDGSFHPESIFFDVFFCEKCLTTSKVQSAHTLTYGDGRREIRHDI